MEEFVRDEGGGQPRSTLPYTSRGNSSPRGTASAYVLNGTQHGANRVHAPKTGSSEAVRVASQAPPASHFLRSAYFIRAILLQDTSGAVPGTRRRHVCKKEADDELGSGGGQPEAALRQGVGEVGRVDRRRFGPDRGPKGPARREAPGALRLRARPGGARGR